MVLCTGLGGGPLGFISRVGRAGRGGGGALDTGLVALGLLLLGLLGGETPSAMAGIWESIYRMMGRMEYRVAFSNWKEKFLGAW